MSGKPGRVLKEGDSKLALTLGLLEPAIPAGTYAAPLVVYDADNAHGLLFCIFDATVVDFSIP